MLHFCIVNPPVMPHSNMVSFRQSVTFDASPARIFQALTNARVHTQFTGSPALISARKGAAFSVYDGYATGTNEQVEPDKLLMQKWRTNDVAWPEGHFSHVRFELSPMPGGKCRLLFTHTQVPAHLAENLKQGWREYYWTPLKSWVNR